MNYINKTSFSRCNLSLQHYTLRKHLLGQNGHLGSSRTCRRCRPGPVKGLERIVKNENFNPIIYCVIPVHQNKAKNVCNSMKFIP